MEIKTNNLLHSIVNMVNTFLCAFHHQLNLLTNLRVTLMNILLRILELFVQLVGIILAHKKFPKVRLTDLSIIDKVRPFVVKADYGHPRSQLASLQLAKTFSPESHAWLETFSSLTIGMPGEFLKLIDAQLHLTIRR